MKVIYTCNVATGKYTNHEGKEKTSWLKIGTMLEKDNGDPVLKLDAMPIGVKDWEGWVQLFKPQDRQGQGNQQNIAQNSAQVATQADMEAFDDPIPSALDEEPPF